MSIYSRKRKCDGIRVWCIQYRDPGGKTRTETAGTARGSAVRLLGQRMEEVKAGKWMDPEARKLQAKLEAQKREGMRFAILAAEYERECLKKYRRQNETQYALRRLNEFFGEFQVDEISRFTVEKYKESRLSASGVFAGQNPVGARTVNKELSLARKLLNWAIYDREMPVSRNVFSRFKALDERPGRRKKDPPSPEEFGR